MPPTHGTWTSTMATSTTGTISHRTRIMFVQFQHYLRSTEKYNDMVTLEDMIEAYFDCRRHKRNTSQRNRIWDELWVQTVGLVPPHKRSFVLSRQGHLFCCYSPSLSWSVRCPVWGQNHPSLFRSEAYANRSKWLWVSVLSRVGPAKVSYTALRCLKAIWRSALMATQKIVMWWNLTSRHSSCL